MPDPTVTTAAESPVPAERIGSRGVKILGETLITPGSSLLMDGEIGRGTAHVAGGLAATWLIGPIGWFLVAASSYASSVTGESTWSRVKDVVD